ncbi:MAG: MFS transporter [Saprospiraceae bacterium]|nr:MAG: MFS transporter [Saprospiraceae bacterium]
MKLNQKAIEIKQVQWARFAVSIIFFNNGFLYANWVSRLPRIQEIYGLDNGSLGMILLAVALGALVAMPFAGWVISSKGTRQITSIGALLFCGVIPFIPLMPGPLFLVALFFCMGITTGILDVAMNAQAVVVESSRKKPIMSSFHAIFSAGMMIGAGTGALFTSLNVTLFQHLIIISVFSLALAIWGIRYLLPDPVSATISNEKPGFRWPTKALVGIGFIAFCCMLGEGAMADWSTNYMRNVAKADKSLAPMGLAAFSFAMMLGRFMGDRMRIALGDSRLLMLSSLTAFLGMLLAILVAQPLVVIAGLFIVGLGLATIVPIAYSTAGAMPGLAPGVGISMVTTIGYSGFLFGPPLIGFLADWQGLRLALLLVLVLFVAMALLSFRQGRPRAVVPKQKKKKVEVLETVFD